MSPRTESQYEVIRETSINKILDASLELFAVHGYEATSISKIASKAGVSKGLIYNYFDSKIDLLKAMLGRLGQGESEIMAEVLDDNPTKMLKNILTLVFREFRERMELWKMILSVSLQVEKFDFVHKYTVDKMRNYYDLFEDLLKKTGYPNPADEAKLLTALFDGIGLHYLIAKEDYPLDQIEKFLIKKYCNNEH